MFRIVALKHLKQQKEVVGDEEILAGVYRDAYLKLANEESLMCAKTGVQVEALPAPHVAIIDVSQSHICIFGFVNLFLSNRITRNTAVHFLRCNTDCQAS